MAATNSDVISPAIPVAIIEPIAATVKIDHITRLCILLISPHKQNSRTNIGHAIATVTIAIAMSFIFVLRGRLILSVPNVLY